MKKSIILIFVLSIFQSSLAQNFVSDSLDIESSTPRADKLFKKMWYKEAAQAYETELNSLLRNKENRGENYLRVLKRTGDAYFFNTDMENAERVYNKLISTYFPNINPEYIFRYAHSLEGIGRYDEAKRWMKEFAKKTQKVDDRSVNYDQIDQTIEDVLNIKPQFVLQNLSINTEYSDFGPMYYKDKLIFSSAADSSNYHTRIYHWNEQPFLNLYVGDLNAIESDIDNVEDFSSTINTRYHEATVTFTPDQKSVYFTRNNYDGELGRDDKGTNHLKLYRADLVQNEEGKEVWENIQELPFNSEEYSVGHPTLSSDGKLLYFVSDMPGSIGGTDIFVVDVFQNKENDSINKVRYSEPRNLGEKVNTAGREMFPFITDKALYFASDGHLGLGGLDVYQSKIIDETFSTPKNLGAPLNSKLDDFSFIIKEKLNRGFVASNRSTGKGDDDIYSFIRVPIIEEKPECDQSIRGYVSNEVTGERIANVNVILYNEKGAQLETTVTNINGAYQFNTVLDCDTKYKVEAQKTGYGKKDKPVLTDKIPGETIVPLGLKTLDKLIVEEGGVLKIKIGIIYFDLNKSFIRNDAAIELNKIVVLMTQYPKMVIKIESHTDARNTDAYNLALSDRRAKSTRDYLISQGIAANRLESAIGYGESRLINKCADGVVCSEAEHQLNRRSEFIIIKM
ncbi:OmpA family protein [uncultured Tenacibaculum sp.]|uniref:OmpA family protein n=1 Tax=uncultured Tenacibaculum sp. TaxID=174713 RepID=UPI0026161617|nr:OmpA family protein [uncultured Tenacibaculum sp.]